MDFGLAKLKDEAGLTKTKTAGTIAYMSPEQIKGEDIDHRVDIWAFGVVLFEMLTREFPFEGQYESAMSYSIVNTNPKSITDIRNDVPLNIEQLIYKALEKDKEKRYKNVNELIEELKKVPSIVSTPKEHEKSIVVLPFVNMSPDPEQEYFSDGLTEEIITDLSHIHDLLVISRSSAMTFKGTKKRIKEIAKEVNVRYVLEGSVRKAGNNLRITAQLIDAITDAHLWAEKYSGTLDDVFDIQEKVSRSIVDALKLKLTTKEDAQIAERPIDNVAAYECYLKAKAEIFKFTEKAIDSAIRNLQNAIDLIGDNTLLYSSMALAYWNLVNIGVKQEEYLVKAEEYVNKALATDPDSHKAHAVLGWINHLVNFLKSPYHLKRALAISPNDPLALQGLAVVYIIIGKISVAVPLVEKLMQIEPLDFMTNACQGLLYFYDGQLDRAFQPLQKLYEIYSENAYSQFFYALILTYHKETDKAFSIIDQSAKADPNNVIIKLGLILKYGILKDKDKVFQEMTPEFHKTCQGDLTFSHHLAGIFAMLDEKEQAMNWLETAVNLGFINYPLLSERDPWLENIRGEERFKKLMERVKYEWENFEV